MTTRIIEIDDLDRAEKEILSIGSERAGALLMAPKALFRVIKLKAVRSPAANIIKQEMLALGGEAATAYGAINCSIKSSDILIFGTVKQLNLLIGKLKPHVFGLPAIAEQISAALHNYETIPKPIKIRHRTLDFGHRTYIMGILNVTPDSFSDGGKFAEVDRAAAHAKQMIADGADIIDIGGQSTRPGAVPISAKEEMKRILPVIERLPRAVISVDTTSAVVARAALKAGAAMVNDISGLRFDPKMARVIKEFEVPAVLMHIQGKPRSMQKDPAYSDLLGEVIGYLSEGLAIAKKAGILQKKIMLDPGIGFGKTAAHNLELLKNLKELKVLGCPILVGASRKAFIGKVLSLPVEERVEGTAAAVAVSIMNGADIVRVHDVKQMVRVARVTDAIVRIR